MDLENFAGNWLKAFKTGLLVDKRTTRGWETPVHLLQMPSPIFNLAAFSLVQMPWLRISQRPTFYGGLDFFHIILCLNPQCLNRVPYLRLSFTWKSGEPSIGSKPTPIYHSKNWIDDTYFPYLEGNSCSNMSSDLGFHRPLNSVSISHWVSVRFIDSVRP